MDRAIEISFGVIIAVVMIIKTWRDERKKKPVIRSARPVQQPSMPDLSQEAIPDTEEHTTTKRLRREEGVKALPPEPRHEQKNTAKPQRRTNSLRRAFIDAEIFNRKF